MEFKRISYGAVKLAGLSFTYCKVEECTRVECTHYRAPGRVVSLPIIVNYVSLHDVTRNLSNTEVQTVPLFSLACKIVPVISITVNVCSKYMKCMSLCT